jgi:hypothetical protein
MILPAADLCKLHNLLIAMLLHMMHFVQFESVKLSDTRKAKIL